MPTRYLLLLCLGGFLLPSLHAQDVLQGRVTDAETSLPLEAVMVSVLRDSMTIDYTLTDADGRYSLPWRHKGTLQVSASMLGYGRQTHDVGKGGRLDFALRTESIVLRERSRDTARTHQQPARHRALQPGRLHHGEGHPRP